MKIFSFFPEWEKPREWLEYERQRQNAMSRDMPMSSNKMPGPGMQLDRRSSSQKQVPMGVGRDGGQRSGMSRGGGGNEIIEYEDVDSRGSTGGGGGSIPGRSTGRMDNIDRTGGTYADPR